MLKELIENSIDAGATQITIHTQQSGKKLLSINDNGSGMSPEDAKICWAHHATSKISKLQDLETIHTYGFRGEALSSITAVATVQIVTKTKQQKSAIDLTLKYGNLINETKSAHSTGTTITITNLFDNVPARKKFLKSNDTEWNGLISIFQAFCLRYQNIHFKLFHDNKLAYNCPSTDSIVQRCAQLWSNDLHDKIIKIDPATERNITISGAISTSHYHRYNRNQIFTFVNNRWVKNIELSRSIIKGYQNVLPPQKYPAAFLFIEIDPTQIDVNIHPKKEEIKFLHPGTVQSIVQQTITKTLNQSITQQISKPTNLTQAPIPKTPMPQSHITFSTTPPIKQPHQQVMSTLFDNPFTTTAPQHNSLPQLKQTIVKKEKQETEDINQTVHKQELFSIIGQFKTTYVLIEKNEELIVIDQHAAHERILYENFKKNFTNVASVKLLFPQTIKLTQADVTTIIQHENLFKQHGIIFEQFNDSELLIQATPVQMQHKAVSEIIEQTLHWINTHEFVDEQEFFKQLNEQIHAQKACKAAYKAGDTLNREQMQNIVQTLLTIENRFCCPHGRPTMWNLNLKELEKFFKRDYKSPLKNSIF